MPELPNSPPLAETRLRPALSRRRRRLRWTIAVLVTSAAVTLSLALWLHVHNRPTAYRPDEKDEDITSSLSRSLPPDAPRPHFTDVTAKAGLGGFRSFVGDRTSQLPEDMGSGLAWGDFNNDGYEDVFLVSAGGPLNAPDEKLAPCELYENLGNGTFRKVAAFPELRIHGMGAAWADYDGDGYLDLVVSGYNVLLLFHNEHGSGRFVRDTRFPERKGFWTGVSWGDYDNDRRPDLYVCGYVQYVENASDRTRTSSQLGTAVPYTLNPASYEPASNLLFHNNGDGTFTEVAQQLGVANPTGRSLGALWHDFDDDGWLDLYVANDIAGSVLYHNTAGKFEDVSDAAWVKDYRSAMGLAAGDYNRDGDDDLFVSHWVAQENALFDNLWADLNRNPRATNRSDQAAQSCSKPPYPLRFMDVNEAKGLGQIALPYVGWGTEFADFDGDGWLDLIVANGNTLEQEGPFPRKLKPQEPFLFWNQRGEFFHNIAPLDKVLSQPHSARGLAVADFDNDGALDVAMIHLGEGVQLLRNQMQTGHWLKLRLHSRLANGAPLGFGDGAKVIAHLGDVGLRRSVSSASYLSQSSRIVHFGLGAADHVDLLEVRWLGGATNLFTNLTANATYDIVEGDPVPKPFAPAHMTAATTSRASVVAPGSGAPPLDKARLAEFWKTERAAMDAMKIQGDLQKAIGLFRAALELNPQHEDSRYYLGNCLAAQGQSREALEQLETLARINPQSHRAFARLGNLRALTAQSDADLASAERALETAHALNPEETGALLALGEVAILRGHLDQAEAQLASVNRTNPRSVGALFLRSYLAEKRGENTLSRELLQKAKEAAGPDWKPKGGTAEGDVRQKWHRESTPLSDIWENWDGRVDSPQTYAALEERLRQQPVPH